MFENPWIPVAERFPEDGEMVDVWFEVWASPSSFGMADRWCEPKVWRKNNKWFHIYEDEEMELESRYISHWKTLGATDIEAPDSVIWQAAALATCKQRGKGAATMRPYLLLAVIGMAGCALGQIAAGPHKMYRALSPKGVAVTYVMRDGFCDIRGDCWWAGTYCHGCGVNGTWPLVVNDWQDYMVPEFKTGTINYVPWPKPPIPEALRRKPL